MKKTFLISLSLFLVTVLAFVCISTPLQARADSASMDYVETDMSTSEVTALFSGTAAFIPAAIMIIGFIVMTYCVLRNIEVPLQFSDQTSFSDKLNQLGQYAIDNASDSIKDFLYSVYTYCNDNGITSIWGLSKFIGLQAGKFFGAFTSWIGGSLINNPSDIGQGLINSFLDVAYLTLDYVNSGVSSVFNQSSSIAYHSTYSLSVYQTGTSYGQTFYKYYSLGIAPAQGVNYSNYVGVLTNNGFYICTVSNGSLVVSNDNLLSSYGSWYYAIGYDLNPSPNLGSYSSVSWSFRNLGYSYQDQKLTLSPTYFYIESGNRWLSNVDLLSFVSSLGLAALYSFDGVTGTETGFSLNDLHGVSLDILNPAVDNVYVPTDVWNIDIVGTWEQIARDISATYDQTERIAAFVGDIPLTLTSAQAYAPTINDAGNYVFPDMTDIWKYPQYFFDTLKGWGLFVGNCISSVTVGEGGLSWIFFGGFVLLVCGGIIGKILMG